MQRGKTRREVILAGRGKARHGRGGPGPRNKHGPRVNRRNEMKGDNVLLKQFHDIKSTGVDMNDHTWVRASAKNRGLSAIASLTKREYQALVRRVSQMNLRIPEAD